MVKIETNDESENQPCSVCCRAKRTHEFPTEHLALVRKWEIAQGKEKIFDLRFFGVNSAGLIPLSIICILSVRGTTFICTLQRLKEFSEVFFRVCMGLVDSQLSV